MRYPVVLFDVGQTLVGPRVPFGDVYARAVAGLGLELTADRLEFGIRQVTAAMSQRIPVGTDRYGHFPGGEEEYWARFSHEVLELAGGAAVDIEVAREALVRLREAFRERSAWEVFADVIPALDSLARDGARLGIVSNWDSRLPEVLDLLELSSRFEVVGVSHLEGVEKPNPVLFHRVLQRMGARPHEALHVGDVPGLDLAGARAAGVDAVLIDRKGVSDVRGRLTDLSTLPQIARDGIPETSG